MTTDRYTKLVLTVIAVSLVWIAIGGSPVLPSVNAQAGVSEVVIVGWQDSSGQAWRLPTVYPAPNPSTLERVSGSGKRALAAFEQARTNGLSLPMKDW